MQQRFDVAVVGAGPAGAACALRLARDGYSVALIDARAFPRDKVCGEYVNPGALEELDALDLHDLYPSCARISSVRFSAHEAVAEIPLPMPARSIPRTLLDDAIRNRAIQAGAVAIAGRVRSLVPSAAAVALTLDCNGGEVRIDARFVVGADGMRSTVAALLHLNKPISSSKFALAAHYTVPAIGTALEIYLGDDGYFALNPSDTHGANVVCVLGDRHLRQHARDLDSELDRFSRDVSGGRHALREMTPRETRRAIGPLSHRTRRVRVGNVLLVGDAAAFVDPFTGQGISLALTGARLAATTLSVCMAAPSKREDALLRYERDLRSMIARRRTLSWIVHSMVADRRIARSADRLWRAMPKLFAPLIGAVCAERGT